MNGKIVHTMLFTLETEANQNWCSGVQYLSMYINIFNSNTHLESPHPLPQYHTENTPTTILINISHQNTSCYDLFTIIILVFLEVK